MIYLTPSSEINLFTDQKVPLTQKGTTPARFFLSTPSANLTLSSKDQSSEESVRHHFISFAKMPS